MLDLARMVMRRAYGHGAHAATYGRPVADEVLRCLGRLSDLLAVPQAEAGHANENPASHEYRAAGRVADQRRPVHCGSVTDTASLPWRPSQGPRNPSDTVSAG